MPDSQIPWDWGCGQSPCLAPWAESLSFGQPSLKGGGLASTPGWGWGSDESLGRSCRLPIPACTSFLSQLPGGAGTLALHSPWSSTRFCLWGRASSSVLSTAPTPTFTWHPPAHQAHAPSHPCTQTEAAADPLLRHAAPVGFMRHRPEAPHSNGLLSQQIRGPASEAAEAPAVATLGAMERSHVRGSGPGRPHSRYIKYLHIVFPALSTATPRLYGKHITGITSAPRCSGRR